MIEHYVSVSFLFMPCALTELNILVRSPMIFFIFLYVARVSSTLVNHLSLMHFWGKGISRRGLFPQPMRSLSYAVLTWILKSNNDVKGIQMVNTSATFLLQFLKKWVVLIFLYYAFEFSSKVFQFHGYAWY